MIWQLPVRTNMARSCIEGLAFGVGWLCTEPAIEIIGSIKRRMTALTSEDVVPGRTSTSVMIPFSARNNPANSFGAVDLLTSSMNVRVSCAIPLIGFAGMYTDPPGFEPGTSGLEGRRYILAKPRALDLDTYVN